MGAKNVAALTCVLRLDSRRFGFFYEKECGEEEKEEKEEEEEEEEREKTRAMRISQLLLQRAPECGREAGNYLLKLIKIYEP